MKKIYKINKLILVFVLSLFSFTAVMAQSNMTKIQDASVSAPNSTPHAGAVLELESNNKGFLTPRLTTGQRDGLPSAKLTNGLLIYNTTTDCFNYWSAQKNTWLSLCGTPPPAVFHITALQCNAIIANGTYKQGDVLTNSNFLTIPVTVTQPGTYEVMATTTNGYYFTTTGTFPNAGSFTIHLQGVGTPNIGYNIGDLGDKVAISLNGTVSNCEPHVFVEKANVAYDMDCATISQEGEYFIGIVTTTDNKLKVSVNVTSTGYWNMYTNTVNGISFAGTGTFNSTGNQQIELLATGTPINSGNYGYTIYSNSDPASSCSNVNVTVANVGYSIDCDNATINGNYMQDVTLTGTNTITLPINVTATGATTISTNTVNGISFSTGLINLTSLGAQTVTLVGAGTPTNGSETELTVTGTPGGASTCIVKIPVDKQPVAFTMSCGTLSHKGSYAPGIAMNASNTMTVTVNATYGGDWSITTDVQNGVSFSGAGTLTVGANTLTLTAAGTPVTGGTFNYTLTSNSASGNAVCTHSVLFVYRKMNVLGLGTGAYQPGTASASESSRAILQSTANFSVNGTLPTQGLTIVNGGYSNGNTVKNLINSNKIDVIVIGYAYNADATARAILEDFVKNKKGVLIHSNETDASGTADLINRITGGSVSVSGSGTTYFNPTTTVDDPVLNGPFYDTRSTGTGSDVNNSYYVANVPSNVNVLAVNGSNSSRAHIFKHKTLGYLYIGDSGWTAGSATNNSTTIWPAKITTSGTPLSKNYSGGTVYNSYIYANALAWAIKYAQENTYTGYVIP